MSPAATRNRGDSPVTRTTRASQVGADAESDAAGWTFLTKHSHVLLCLVIDPQLPLRDVALKAGITERSVQRIVGELEAAGYLVRRREGRNNRYVIRRSLSLRHPIEMHKRLGDLIAMVLGT